MTQPATRPDPTALRNLAALDVRPVSAEVFVCGQITPAHVAAIAAAGFASLICNRPDGEGPGQPGYDDIAAAAAACGLPIAYVPVVSGRITEADAEQMLTAVNELPKPALAYCRSGARSTMLWRLASAL